MVLLRGWTDSIEIYIIVIIVQHRLPAVIGASVGIRDASHPPGKNHSSSAFRVRKISHCGLVIDLDEFSLSNMCIRLGWTQTTMAVRQRE